MSFDLFALGLKPKKNRQNVTFGYFWKGKSIYVYIYICLLESHRGRDAFDINFAKNLQAKKPNLRDTWFAESFRSVGWISLGSIHKDGLGETPP